MFGKGEHGVKQTSATQRRPTDDVVTSPREPPVALLAGAILFLPI